LPKSSGISFYLCHNMRMKKKIDILRSFISANDWEKAISLSAKFPRLGFHKEAITRAHMAYTNPRFLVQIGKDVEECKQLGIAAIIDAYSIR